MLYTVCMKKKFRISPLLTCAFVSCLCFLSACLFSCNKTALPIKPPEQKSILLGFSQIGAESAWRTCHSQAVQRAAEEAGIQLLFSNAEQKQENQIKAIRSFIVYRVDVIAFVPIVQDGWDNVLKEARDAHIPVIVCDRKIRTSDRSLYAAYIGTDSEEEGKRAAQFLQKKFAGRKAADKVLNILEIRGTDGSSASDDRIKGFHAQLAGDRSFRIIHSESGNFMRSRGREIALGILERSGGKLRIDSRNIDILFSANDDMTLGFLEALSEKGITGHDFLTVVTVDAQQEAIDALQQGKINCVIECTPYQGRNIMRLARELAAGKSVERTELMEECVFSEFDDLSGIAPRGY